MIPASIELPSYTRVEEELNQPAGDEDCPICYTALPDTFRDLIMSKNSVTINQDLMIHRPEAGKDHVFHLVCMQEWFKKQQTCPSCKENLSTFHMPDPSIDPTPPQDAAPQNDALHPEIAQVEAEVAVVVQPVANQIPVPQNRPNHGFKTAVAAATSVGLSALGGTLMAAGFSQGGVVGLLTEGVGAAALAFACCVIVPSIRRCYRERNAE